MAPVRPKTRMFEPPTMPTMTPARRSPRQVRLPYRQSLQSGIGEQVCHRHRVRGCEHLEYPHPHAVGESCEEVGLDLVQRAIFVRVPIHAAKHPRFHNFIVSLVRKGRSPR